MSDKKIYLVVALIVFLVSALLHIYKVEPFETFSLRFNDINFALQEKKINPDIVFVAVDEPSVNSFGRWPWKRDLLAQGIEKLSQADVVLLDMIFSEYTNLEDDQALSDAVASLNNSVCGFFLRNTSTQTHERAIYDVLANSSLDKLQIQLQEYDNPRFVSAPFAELNILPITESCSLNGSFSTLAESDHLLRAYPIAVYFENLLYPSLAIQGARLKFDADIQRVGENRLEIATFSFEVNEKGFVRLNFYNPSQYKIISFLDVATAKVAPEYFKNKIVILGITEVGAGDVVATPLGRMYGPLLHYTFLSNLLENHIIKEPKYITLSLMLLMVLVPLLFVFFIKKVLYRAIGYILLYSVLYAVVRLLFIYEMIYIDLFYPLVALIGAVVAIESLAFNLQEKSSKFVKEAFSSYLSKDLLQKLIAQPEALKLGGEKRELTILFSDIRGFTTFSEGMDPVVLISLLNRYFSPMTDAVINNGGMLDKYIGDAVMAFFNAPVDVVNHPDAACKSALEMIESLEKLNAVFVKEGLKEIHIGIGINTAEVVVGNMGSTSRINYTVIGDGVNLASRVEGLTKNYGVAILITEFTHAKLHENFLTREIEAVVVKGKDEAVLLYELMQDNARNQEIKKLYDAALNLYKKSDFKEAQLKFEFLVEQFQDGVSKYFLDLVKQEHPWGVHKMTTK